MGKGCPACGQETRFVWSDDYIKTHPEKVSAPCILYVVEFASPEQRFWKVGITVNTVAQRYAGKMYQRYSRRIVHTVTGTAEEMKRLEKKIHNEDKLDKYDPKRPFAGHTECYKHTELLELCEFIDNEINGNDPDYYTDIPHPATQAGAESETYE